MLHSHAACLCIFELLNSSPVVQISDTLRGLVIFEGASVGMNELVNGLECAMESALAALCVSITSESQRKMSDSSNFGSEVTCAKPPKIYPFPQILPAFRKSDLLRSDLSKHTCTTQFKISVNVSRTVLCHVSSSISITQKMWPTICLIYLKHVLMAIPNKICLD